MQPRPSHRTGDRQILRNPETPEMYGEPFGIPTPDEQVFISWFEGGEVFRSGCTWKRGNGKIFYFRPGHETYPIYHHATVKLVLKNAVRWAAPEGSLSGSIRARMCRSTKPPNRSSKKEPACISPAKRGCGDYRYTKVIQYFPVLRSAMEPPFKLGIVGCGGMGNAHVRSAMCAPSSNFPRSAM